MAEAGIVLALISAATSIAGGVAASRNARAEAKFRRQAGEIEAEDRRRQTRRLIASQQVAFAKAGLGTTVGTPLDVLGDTVMEAELGALRTKFAQQAQAASVSRRGQQAQVQGIVSGLGTILGAANAFGKSTGKT